jgi:L-lactate dehydrogenase complex protein LldE
MSSANKRHDHIPRVGLFVTCLVDLFRPVVGFAAIKLIEASGCSVETPMAQTCCGQPGHNSGDRKDARRMAEVTIETFEDFDYIVAPSGACAGMLKKHYPGLFNGDPDWEDRAATFSKKVHELVSFLSDVRGVTDIAARLDGTATYHDACSGLRELGIRAQPRALLGSIDGLTLIEIPGADACCGIGGAYCSRSPAISNAIAGEKTSRIQASGADMLLAGDLGCLMSMAGRLKRQGSKVETRHVAEVLAGMTDGPPIGGGS